MDVSGWDDSRLRSNRTAYVEPVLHVTSTGRPDTRAFVACSGVVGSHGRETIRGAIAHSMSSCTYVRILLLAMPCIAIRYQTVKQPLGSLSFFIFQGNKIVDTGATGNPQLPCLPVTIGHLFHFFRYNAIIVYKLPQQ